MVDSFVGRRQELADLARLSQNYRLITLFGPAGAGKTRIAREFAASARFADGTHLVELGGLRRPELVAQAVASAVGAVERPGATVEETLADALDGKALLLVLDNCEHLVEACSSLATAILTRCPQTRILATSREVLRLPGEHVLPVGGLAAGDAVQLFADRATSVAPAFALGENRDLVRSICHRLDDLPLAVELAARLVRLLSLGYILTQLDDQLTLLTSGTRDADTRHKSLPAAIAWSYGLLGPDEQALLRRLSVAPGGFDVELATAISADLGLPVIELIAGLESKSLVTPMRGATGQPRFRQWESVRMYAKERLVEHGEWEDTAERLVAALADLAAPPAENGRTERRTVDRLRAERDNLLFAVDFLRDRADAREPLLVAALARSRAPGDGTELAPTALEVEDGPSAYVRALDEAAWHELALRSGEPDQDDRPLRHRATNTAAGPEPPGRQGDEYGAPPYLLEGSAPTALRPGHGQRPAERRHPAMDPPAEPWWPPQVADVRTRMGDDSADRGTDPARHLPDGMVVHEIAPAPEPPPISEREREVATLVAHGRTNIEIARRLRISQRTVESHLQHLRTKLNLRSRAHLAAWAAQNL